MIAPRCGEICGEPLGDGRGETRGEDRGGASGRWAGTADCGCFLGMRLRRWLTHRCCSSRLPVSKSSSLAVDMS